MALVMLDIDDYKRFNDTYGHVVGDMALAIMGQIIRSHVRAADTPARFGGEEFAALLPDTDLVSAALVAERIRASVEATPFPAGERGTARLTVSLGVALSDGSASNPDLFMI